VVEPVTVVYSAACITARLSALAGVIDARRAAGSLVLLAGNTPVSTVTLTRPCGSANGNVLTFNTPLTDPSARGSGNVTSGRFQDSNGVVMASVLDVGIPGSSASIVIANGVNSTAIAAGQVLVVLSAQITTG
jgi:hypothetical protein